MHLGSYLKESGLSQAAFGRVIGVSQAAVERYVNNKRIPDAEVMSKIFTVTSGVVTANDFYGIPPETPATAATNERR